MGGIWAGDGVYECLRLQQHKDDFTFRGLPWPEGTSAFPTRDEVLAQVRAFSRLDGLSACLRLGTGVVSMCHDAATGLWTTTTDGGNTVRSRLVAFSLATCARRASTVAASATALLRAASQQRRPRRWPCFAK